nr:hypothetical protein [uncultured Sellimonas sp.]
MLETMEYDDYDYLIQLCDSIAVADGIVTLEERMNDVKSRYGYYPQEKWDRNMELKQYFEEKMGKELYRSCSDGRLDESIGCSDEHHRTWCQ